MLKYKLIRKEGCWYIYEYYPDGNTESPGEIGITDSWERKIIKVSKEDFENRYAGHALYGIKPGVETGTIAWY